MLIIYERVSLSLNVLGSKTTVRCIRHKNVIVRNKRCKLLKKNISIKMAAGVVRLAAVANRVRWLEEKKI